VHTGRRDGRMYEDPEGPKYRMLDDEDDTERKPGG
jgi:nitrogen fixation-related uncharacterized protein